MIGKHCRKAKKRKYNSRAAALRAGTQRYGESYARDAYRCPDCSTWHLTRAGVKQRDFDDGVEQLAAALLGKKAS